MHIIDAHLIRRFARDHAQARKPFEEWMKDSEQAYWQTPQDVKNHWPDASILSGNRVIFNIKENEYRMLTVIDYVYASITIVRIGTHQEYDRWNL